MLFVAVVSVQVWRAYGQDDALGIDEAKKCECDEYYSDKPNLHCNGCHYLKRPYKN